MKNTKRGHTPGPWSVSGQKDTGGNIIWNGVENIALVLSEKHYNAAGEPVEQSEVNTALIAAAPDLLAALENMVNGRDVNDMARLAIAKAKGASGVEVGKLKKGGTRII